MRDITHTTHDTTPHTKPYVHCNILSYNFNTMQTGCIVFVFVVTARRRRWEPEGAGFEVNVEILKAALAVCRRRHVSRRCQNTLPSAVLSCLCLCVSAVPSRHIYVASSHKIKKYGWALPSYQQRAEFQPRIVRHHTEQQRLSEVETSLALTIHSRWRGLLQQQSLGVFLHLCS